MTGALPVLLVLALVLWQIVLVGMTFVFSGHAARAGARAFAVGDAVQPAALKAVPGGWMGGVQVKPHTPAADAPDPQDIEGAVTVSICVPMVVPGFGCLVRIPTTANTVLEETALASERPDLTILSGGSSFGPGSPPRVAPHFVSGTTATIFDPPGGGPPQATVPTGLPPAVQLMIQAANDIVSYPYCYGGGHDAPNFWPTVGIPGDGYDSCYPGPAVGYDCSGAVEWVLHQGIGYDNAGVSGSIVLPGSGKGQYVTVQAGPSHVRMTIAGLDFESIGAQQRIGPTWYPVGQLGFPDSTYSLTHPTGL